MSVSNSTADHATPPRKTGRGGASSARVICLSLISHTNVGKTTLARTLLRRDVGLIMDAEHVTDLSEAHTMLETPSGERLLLWDTPGFGNTATLVKRLRRSHQPVVSFLLETWDRFRNRSLWCSQQALRNVQDESDVVLYLVDASQKPADSEFVGMEMEILRWIGKPVIVLLNQLGPPKIPLAEELEVEEWRLSLRRHEIVRSVISMDAFARCWIQEEVLLDLILPLLPDEKRQAYGVLKNAWIDHSQQIFAESMAVLGRQLAESLMDRVTVSKETFLQKFGLGRKSLNDEMEHAREQLSERLAERSIHASNALIRLHDLTGERRATIEKSREENFQVPQTVNESLWTAVGGILSGAAVGVVADIKTGGMTLGGGTVLGVFAGGAGSYLLAKGYNLARGGKDYVRWTEEHFAAQVEMALLFYLAISHWGRGRGEWAEADFPLHWREKVRGVVGEMRKRIDQLWNQVDATGVTTEQIQDSASTLLNQGSRLLLSELYPNARFREPS